MDPVQSGGPWTPGPYFVLTPNEARFINSAYPSHCFALLNSPLPRAQMYQSKMLLGPLHHVRSRKPSNEFGSTLGNWRSKTGKHWCYQTPYWINQSINQMTAAVIDWDFQRNKQFYINLIASISKIFPNLRNYDWKVAEIHKAKNARENGDNMHGTTISSGFTRSEHAFVYAPISKWRIFRWQFCFEIFHDSDGMRKVWKNKWV